ncbi:hypothetical protein TNCV_3035521 [Trichonephila clavipes]|nr:hypothetical protein TNCV_3035521 [Trichonephila clavipes]
MLVHILRDSPNNVFKDMMSYPWPARSPDLSPIEHVWTLGRQCSPRYRRINCADAKTMAGSSTGVISDLIESMPRRISACIAARGGFTTY